MAITLQSPAILLYPSAPQEVLLEVINESGEVVFDRGPVIGPKVFWAFKNKSG